MDVAGSLTSFGLLFKTPNGDIVVKPKGGKGPGDPTGFNINELKKHE